MRYLRMLTNSLIGGLLVAAYLTLLVLHLNPSAGLNPAQLAPLYITLTLSYGAVAALCFYTLILARQMFSAELLSPGWLSVRLLGWLLAGASAVAAALMWMNLMGFRGALDPRAMQRMTIAAVVLTACAAIMSTFAVLHYSFGRRGNKATAIALVLIAIASFGLPLAARGKAVEDRRVLRTLNAAVVGAAGPVPHVMIILLDGASLEVVAPAAAEGRLPNFGRILDSGASMHLATLRPTQPEPVWTAVATGKLPYKNGVPSTATYAVRGGDQAIGLLPDYCFAQALIRFGFLLEQPRTSSTLTTRPFWEILSGLGISSGVVGWPLTFPVNPVRGYLVSDRFYHPRGESSRDAVKADADAVYPEEAVPLVAAARAAPGAPASARAIDAASAWWPANKAGTVALGDPLSLDTTYDRIATDLQNTRPAQVTAVRYPGVDLVAHYYLRYAVPSAFGDVSDEDRRRYGRVLDQYYAHLDAIVGRAAAGLGPSDLLLVISGFGMEPLSPEKRLLERIAGNPSLSGTHERAPDGFLIAYGSVVRAGRLTRGSVVDMVPTLLYFLGMPVGRDMDGYARTDIFTQSFTAERPITFIPTYDR